MNALHKLILTAKEVFFLKHSSGCTYHNHIKTTA